MAKQVRHESSRPFDEGVAPGCWGGIFHSFDIHHHLRRRKLLGQRRNAHESNHATGVKVQKRKLCLPPAGDEDYVAKEEKDTTVEDRSETAKKDSGKAQMRAVLGREASKQKGIAKQKGQKQKANTSSTQLVRTISIHHMECDDYVHPGEIPDNSKEALNLSHKSGSSVSNKHMSLSPNTASEVDQGKRCEVCGMLSGAGKYGHNLLDVLGYRLVENQAFLREKMREAKYKLLEHQTVDGKGVPRDAGLDHSKDFLETLELFDVSREMLLKILHEQGATQDQEGSSTGRVLSKSGSFPVARFSGRTAPPFELKCRRDETGYLRKKERKSDTEISQTLSTINSTGADKSQAILNTLEPVSDIHGVDELASNSEQSSSFTQVMKTQRDNGTAVYHFKDIKRRIKDIIKDNKEERQRISTDGVLHKIPYGYKVTQEKPGPWEVPSSGSYNGDHSSNSFGSGRARPDHRNANGHMRRSHSLTESLDRYSYLLELNFSGELKRQRSERLKMVPEDSGFQVINSRRTYKRMLSLPEFSSFFLGKDIQSEASADIIHSSSASVDLAQGINRTDEQKTSTIFESSLDNIKENNASTTSVDPDRSTLGSRMYGASDNLETEKILEHIKENNSSTTSVDPDRSTLGSVIYAASENLETEKILPTGLNERAMVSEGEWSHEPETPSPISVLDSCLPDDLVSPAKFSVLPASPELKSRQFEELEPSDSPLNQSDIDDSSMERTDGSDVSEEQTPGMQPDFDTTHVPVNNMHEFHFVKDVLKKYWFDGEERVARWNSPCHQLSSSNSEDAEGLAYELEPSSKGSDVNFNYALFDLTNEVLLEIYETSYDHCPWLSHSCSCIRPIPVGHHILEEVWANISWLLKSQPHANLTLESIISQDFKKNNQWMNLRYDIESMELDLEVLIFDDLLDEAIIECLDLACQQ